MAILHVRQGAADELLIKTNANGAFVDVVRGVRPAQAAEALALYEEAHRECPTPRGEALRQIHAPEP